MPVRTPYKKTVVILCLLAFSTVAGYLAGEHFSTRTGPAPIDGLLWPDPLVLGEFSVIDHQGRTFGLEQLRGRWSLLFFGYTHCPDVCPFTLGVMQQVYRRAADAGQAENLQVVFVSIDPERDTRERLADYVSYFGADFIGLGGTPEQVKGLADQLGVAYLRSSELQDGGYLMDHSAAVFLTDTSARLVSIFSAPQEAGVIFTRWQAIREYFDDRS